METKTIVLDQTPISDNFREYMRCKFLFNFENHISVSKIIASTIWATAKYLSSLENKREVANGVYMYQESNPDIKFFASILEYDANEENADNPGAYEFTTSYDPEVTKRAMIPFSNDGFSSMLYTTLVQTSGYIINDNGIRNIICAEALAFLKKFVEDQVQANPTEIIEFEHPGIFMVRGGEEDGHIIVSMIPGADLKHKCIKDDANSEK